jgi:hypothetical protein
MFTYARVFSIFLFFASFHSSLISHPVDMEYIPDFLSSFCFPAKGNAPFTYVPAGVCTLCHGYHQRFAAVLA